MSGHNGCSQDDKTYDYSALAKIYIKATMTSNNANFDPLLFEAAQNCLKESVFLACKCVDCPDTATEQKLWKQAVEYVKMAKSYLKPEFAMYLNDVYRQTYYRGFPEPLVHTQRSRKDHVCESVPVPSAWDNIEKLRQQLEVWESKYRKCQQEKEQIKAELDQLESEMSQALAPCSHESSAQASVNTIDTNNNDDLLEQLYSKITHLKQKHQAKQQEWLRQTSIKEEEYATELQKLSTLNDELMKENEHLTKQLSRQQPHHSFYQTFCKLTCELLTAEQQALLQQMCRDADLL
jgi:hypothetical protein